MNAHEQHEQHEHHERNDMNNAGERRAMDSHEPPADMGAKSEYGTTHATAPSGYIEHAAHSDHEQHGDHGDHGDHGGHAGHSEAMFSRPFWIALVLSIPIIIYAPLLEEVFHYQAPQFPGSAWLSPVLVYS